jgi:hypothetical protein
MNPFENITRLILDRLLRDGIRKFNLSDIKNIIEMRNDMLDLFEMGWINWSLIDNDEPNEDEVFFRDDSYKNIIEACSEDGFDIQFDEIDRIFRIEKELVGNKEVNYYTDSFISFDDNRTIPFTEMNFKKEFIILRWTDWKETIDSAIADFYEEFAITPNVLFANEYTFSQFNFLVNNVPGEKKNIVVYDEEQKKEVTAENLDFVGVSSFKYDDFSVIFIVDENLDDRKFILDYDDDLNWEDDDDDDDNGGDNDFSPVFPSPIGRKHSLRV